MGEPLQNSMQHRDELKDWQSFKDLLSPTTYHKKW